MKTLKAREKFLRKRALLQKNQPFTKKENKTFTLQEKNYIRGIQIARNVSKKDAIKLFKKSRKNENLAISLSKEIEEKYKTGIIFKPLEKPPIILESPKKKKEPKKKILKKKKKPKKKISKKKKKPKKKIPKKKTKYKYAGKSKKATKKQLERFKSLGGTSRRYIDIYTGEEISRRERDKRL